jgi:hypothetical protein
MALQPSQSVGIGLATAGLVLAIHSQATPTMADIRVGAPNDDQVDRGERAASWLSVGVVSAISLLTKDPTIFIIGGAATVAMAWWTRHSNALNPLIGVASQEGMSQRVDLRALSQGPGETEDSNLGAGDESVVGF